MADLTDDQLDRIKAHSRGGLPPEDGEHYVEVLVAEVRRLRKAVGVRDERLARWKSVWRRGRDQRLATEAERDRLRDGIAQLLYPPTILATDDACEVAGWFTKRARALLGDQEDTDG